MSKPPFNVAFANDLNTHYARRDTSSTSFNGIVVDSMPPERGESCDVTGKEGSELGDHLASKFCSNAPNLTVKQIRNLLSRS